MAAPATNIDFVKAGLRERIGGVLAGLGRALDTYMHDLSRAEQVKALDAKSDAELAAMGLTRDKIVHHVFRDVYYV